MGCPVIVNENHWFTVGIIILCVVIVILLSIILACIYYYRCRKSPLPPQYVFITYFVCIWAVFYFIFSNFSEQIIDKELATDRLNQMALNEDIRAQLLRYEPEPRPPMPPTRPRPPRPPTVGPPPPVSTSSYESLPLGHPNQFFQGGMSATVRPRPWVHQPRPQVPRSLTTFRL